ncbi:MAG TPA: helix-turn-helix domain-containing protein [Bryobacteraceae bacterium]|jgi:AraC family L-rhamnose operon transcriptional activator RhaR
MVKFPVDVLWIARYDYGPGWVLRMHQHDYLQMILFLDGAGIVTVGARRYQIHGGELFLIRAGETHSLRAATLLRTLDVKFRVVPGDLARRLRRAAVMRHWSEPTLATRLERIRAEGEQKPPFYRELCSLLLTEILYLYLREDHHAIPAAGSTDAPGTGSRDTLLARALACIRDRFHESLTVRDIARTAGCTDRTLRLHFQSALRLQPLKYLQRYRIAQAKSLIQYSDYALKEIAERTGFQTVHHFTRLFTATEKRSPAAWRREYLEGIRKDVYINPEFENRIFTIPSRK